ncbi:MAG: glycoside hydrolase family 43 protein [Bacteroidota bacterium]
MSTFLTNPILTGFHPDPSIIRVGADYYLATSTFEWFPGVQIYHSRDLQHWELIARPLRRRSQLDLRGVPDSGGVWAPCLSYDRGTFYLVYSNLRSFDGPWKDVPNFLVTTQDIRGDWSEPCFLTASGFDASLFHDWDGKKWLVHLLVDHRDNRLFGGIVLQEWDPVLQRLVGPRRPIFQGTDLGRTEGPHLYRRGDYYYLLTAEGGTEYGHAVTLARSRHLEGPYEVHPHHPLLSSRDCPEHPLQKTGHADWVMGENGDCHLVFLTGRPLTTGGRCTLGRETALEVLEWRADAWPYLAGGGRLARLHVPAPPLPPHPFPTPPARHHWETGPLPPVFQSLRRPIDENWLQIRSRAPGLRLRGGDSLSSLHEQSLIARRVQHFHCRAATELHFLPEHFQQLAGLVAYYNTAHYYYLHLRGDDTGTQTQLQLLACDHYQTVELLRPPLVLPRGERVRLQLEWRGADLQFFYALDAENWRTVGPTLDGSILSDDYVREGDHRYRPAFTGAFVGICCQDLSGQQIPADFFWWEYAELTNEK